MPAKHLPKRPHQIARRHGLTTLPQWAAAIIVVILLFCAITLLAWLPLLGCAACDRAYADSEMQTIPEPTSVDTPTAVPAPTETPTVPPAEIAIDLPTDTPTMLPTETATETPADTPTTLPTETATETPTYTPTVLPTETATELPTETPTATDTALPTATSTATPAARPRVLITELMIDPKAVSDGNGEWVEIYNAGNAEVNLRGWKLESTNDSGHTIAADVLLQPGAYTVLARNTDFAANGKVPAVYKYASVELNNSGTDTLALWAPDELLVDDVAWANWSPANAGKSRERANLDDPAQWVAASLPWPGSAGDLGSPGAAYAPPSAATATPTPAITATPFIPPAPTETETATAIPTWTPENSPTATASPTASPAATATFTPATTPTPIMLPTATDTPIPLPTPTPTPSPTPTSPPTPAPRILITELMIAPNALNDTTGEWFELFNADTMGVNLQGWRIMDLDDDESTIGAALWIEPGQYIVLGRSLTENASAPIAYVYAGTRFADAQDELLLVPPGAATPADAVLWGDDRAFQPKTGHSAERIGFTEPAIWQAAASMWPGSLGNYGSPGQPNPLPLLPTATFTPLPTATHTTSPTTAGRPTATATDTPLPAATDGQTVIGTPSPTVTGVPSPSATDTPSPTAAATHMPTPTSAPTSLPRLLLTELLIDPGAVSDTLGEWIEVHNASDTTVSLRGWTLGTLDRVEHTIVADLWLEPDAYAVLARNNDAAINGGVAAAYRYSGIFLANGDDSVALRAPDGSVVDAVAWSVDSGLALQPGASLERTTLDDPAQWAIAARTWPGSSGDFGSPGAPYAPRLPTPTPAATIAPTPTLTATTAPVPAATAIPSPTVTATSTLTPAATPLPRLTDMPSPTTTFMPSPAASASPTATPASVPAILIAEIMIDPMAVPDSDGEWVELFNAGEGPENLAGWALGDFDGVEHVIAGDLWLAAGEYAVLARSDDRTANGGVTPRYIYAGVTLANSSDELLLLDPQGTLLDIVLWGHEQAPAAPNGASLERTSLTDPAVWLEAHRLWPGSAGDRGSPGAAYAPPPPPTATATATASSTPTPTKTITPTRTPTATKTPALTRTPTPTKTATPIVTPTVSATLALTPGATPSPSATATDTPTLMVLPSATPSPAQPDAVAALMISEVMVNPLAVGDAVGEWVEIYNPHAVTVDLAGWVLADLDSDHYLIQPNLSIAPGAYIVLGRSADSTENGNVPVAQVYSGLTLANTGDELLLLAPNDAVVDQVLWGDAAGLPAPNGASLERSTMTTPAQWLPAAAPWPGSAGDKGSPGAANAPPSTVEPTPTPSTAATSAPLPTTTPTLSATPAPTPFPDGPPPRVLISEFMANPQAVADDEGEWIELVNGDTVTVNLRDWVLRDDGSDRHRIAADLYLPPGEYAVLGVAADAAVNGGVSVRYTYRSVTLANRSDALVLELPDGRVADSVRWSDAGGVATTAGASLERVATDPNAAWTTAQQPWPGSAGDFGSPGQGYVAPPTQTPAATAPAAWVSVSAPAALQIEEFAYQGSSEEFMALLNTGDSAINLAGWHIGDAQQPGGNEGIYRLPDAVVLAPGELYVVARDAAAFSARFGRQPMAEFEDADPNVPTLVRRTDLGKGRLALDDGGDEIVLIDPALQLADAVAYGDGDFGALGLTGVLRTPSGLSAQRVPQTGFPFVADVRHRFLLALPDPFAAQILPPATAQDAPHLSGDFIAVWGTLGMESNFTSGFTAPPHYVLAAARSQGLDFAAIADTAIWEPALSQPPDLITFPAWRWEGDGAAAIVYHNRVAAMTTLDGLATYLAETGADVQWLGGDNPHLPSVFGHAPPAAAPPDNLATWFNAWSVHRAPLLPAGNANPDLPGAHAIAPRYTGLAVTGKDYGAVWAALRARRGWITSTPSQWLTLRVETADGQTHWMGSQVAAGNRLVAHVEYGDRRGAPAALAIWQDGRPLRQLNPPPTNGAWTVEVPAIPGSILAAVATQADGNWAVTAPIMVAAGGRGTVLINEALPAPRNDLNRDGVVDSEDEFIELYNPGAEPVALAGWQLSDAQGDGTPASRFTFGASRFIAGGERLLLWRRETRLSLDNGADSLRLLDANGEERDATRWDESLPRGRSMARVPDGQAWLTGAAATPGDPNRPAGPDDIFDNSLWPTPTPRPPGGVGSARPPDIPTLEPSHGQAGGPPASVAQSKLAGLKSWVEFFAVVTVPPGLYNGTIYVADPASDGATAGIGVNVYLRRGEFPPLVEGEQVRVRGRFDSFRGEMELVLDSVEQIWPMAKGAPLKPLPVTVADIGETLEGRLVTFRGAVVGWQGDSILLVDPAQPDIPAVRVTVRSSLAWKRPFVQKGQWWQVTGIVSQFALEHPWNGGYRVLVRYKSDLVRQ